MQTEFRTTFNINPSENQFSHLNSFLLMGSCFSKNIGSKLKEAKFDTLCNPFGISYNPISIHQQLQPNFEASISELEGIYFSHDLHSDQNQQSESEFLLNFNNQKNRLNKQLKNQPNLIITYGTSWVYELISEKKIVNNCQKIPSRIFTKRLLSVEEIVESWNKLATLLKTNYPKINVIFTISPVRHLKDGFHENQLSKSTLMLAINKICSSAENCSYFPSYELVIDDLRDYRFFTDDMIHPNEQAIEYIWNFFTQTYFSPATLQLLQQIKKLNTSLQHRAFQPDSAKHQRFLLNLKSKIKAFQLANNLDFEEEINYLKRQIG